MSIQGRFGLTIGSLIDQLRSKFPTLATALDETQNAVNTLFRLVDEILDAPAITDFSNAQHDHSGATEGGALLGPLNMTGPIGVNTDAPYDQLHVVGGLRVGSGSNGFGFSTAQDVNGNLTTQYKNPTSVFADSITLGFAGNVGIGTGTAADPAARLEIKQNTSVSTPRFRINNVAAGNGQFGLEFYSSTVFLGGLFRYGVSGSGKQEIWAAGATGVVLTANDGGYILQRIPPTAVTDADLANSSMAVWYDEAANNLKFRVRSSAGVLKTGTLAVV